MNNQDNSVVYGFLLNMWIMGKVDDNYLSGQVVKERISIFEKDMILATPQIKK